MNDLIVDNSYRLVIKAVINGEVRSFEADIQDEPRITTSSTLTNQPMVNGVKVGDHIFREPITMSISGSFSLVGNQPTRFDGSTDRLSSVERIFEKIKNEGIFCTLVTMNRKSNQLVRYMRRTNMILTNIQWTEGLDILNFDFTFKEVILIDVEATEVETEDNSDLPDITDAIQGDFTDTFLDVQEVIKVTIQTLAKYDLVGDAFVRYWASYGAKDAALLGLGVAGVAVISAASAIVIALGGSLSTVPVIGWIIAAGVAVYAIGCLIRDLIASIQRQQEAAQFKIEAFKYDPNASEEENNRECQRFNQYLVSICENLEELENKCQIYTIANTVPQEAMLYVDDSYYIFKFTRNCTSAESDDEVELEITDVNGSVVATLPIASSLTSIGDCNKNNRLFSTSSGYDVYLMNNAETVVNNGTKTYEGTKEEQLEKAKADLSNYIILVSQINMEQYSNLLRDLTINAMKKAVD